MELMKNDEIDRIIYGLNEKNISESAKKILEKASFEEALAKRLLSSESESEFLLNLCHCFINKIDSLEAANKRAGRRRKYILDEDEVYSLHEQGYSCRQITEKTNIPFATVSRIIRRKKNLIEIKKRIAEHERELEACRKNQNRK